MSTSLRKVLVQGGSNMTGTDLCVNKLHCTASAQCGLFTHKSVPVIFEPPCIMVNLSLHCQGFIVIHPISRTIIYTLSYYNQLNAQCQIVIL